jgi:thymidylate kinase
MTIFHSSVVSAEPQSAIATPSAPPCIEVVGIDGAGKSTVVRHLAGRLRWRERKVRPFTPDAVEQDRRVSGRFGTATGDSFRGCLLAAALLSEAADLTAPTVFDRYLESAWMWWTVKGVWPLSEPVLRTLPAPTAVLLLDAPVGVGLSRRVQTTERSPAAETRFLDACRDHLRDRAASSGWTTVDAAAPLPDVLARVTEWARTFEAEAS